MSGFVSGIRAYIFTGNAGGGLQGGHHGDDDLFRQRGVVHRRCLVLCLLLIVFICPAPTMKAQATENKQTRLTPINVVEAIFEEFWADQQSMDAWEVEDGSAHELEVTRDWQTVTFAWHRDPGERPALKARRTYDLDTRGYDNVVLSMVQPKGTVARLTVETDSGTVSKSFASKNEPKVELELPLEGAARLDALTIEILAQGRASGFGYLYWIGLQNESLLERHLQTQARLVADRSPFLKDASFQPAFKPRYGIYLDDALIETMRQGEPLDLEAGAADEQEAEKVYVVEPEELFHDYVGKWDDTRFNRERDHGKGIVGYANRLAIQAVVERDA